MKKLKVRILSLIGVVSLLGVLNIKFVSDPNPNKLNIEDLKQSALAESELYSKINEPCSWSDPIHVFREGCYYFRYWVCYNQYCLEGGPSICFDLDCGWACEQQDILDYCLGK